MDECVFLIFPLFRSSVNLELPDGGGSLFLREKYERRHKAHRRREEKENSELTDKVGNERFSGLLVKGERYSVVGDEMIEKVVNGKHHCRYNEGYQRKFQ